MIYLTIVLCVFSQEKNETVKLRQGEFYTEKEGKAELNKLESMYSNKQEWESRRKLLRASILKGLNLYPFPVRTPLNSVIKSKRTHNGYTVENVYFESLPGYYV